VAVVMMLALLLLLLLLLPDGRVARLGETLLAAAWGLLRLMALKALFREWFIEKWVAHT